MKQIILVILLLAPGYTRSQWKATGGGANYVTAFGVHDSYLFFATDAPGVGRYRADTSIKKDKGIDFSQGLITSFAFIGKYLIAGGRSYIGGFDNGPGSSWRTSDDGNSWSRSAGGNVCVADRYVLNAEDGIYRVSDSGAYASWEHVSTVNVIGIASVGTTIYAWGSNLWVSSDTGSHWSQLPQPPFMGTVLPMGSLLFINDESGGRVIESTDQGATWNPVHVDSAGRPVAVHHLVTDGRRLYAGAKNGIFFSLDTARSWYCGNGGRLPTLLDVDALIVYDTLLVADFGRADKNYYTTDARPISEMIQHDGPKSEVKANVPKLWVSIYPNPISNKTTISLIGAPGEAPATAEVVIYDVLGHAITTFRMNSSYEWNTKGLAQGSYIIHVTSGSLDEVRRVTIER